MATLIDLFKEFHRNATQQEYPPSSRVLYMTLLGEFNSARWPDSLVLSTRDLTQLTGLPTTSVHRAKQFLTSKGIIKCRPFKNKTSFSLTEQSRNSNGTVTEQSRNTFENPNIHARDKTQDVKTVDNQSVSQSRGRACAFNWDVETEERLTALWLENCGAGVTFELLSYLRFIVEKHGVDFAEELIREMAGSLKGDRMTLNFLRGAYNFKLKGGDRNVRVAQQSRNNRPNVLAFTAQRTAGDFGNASGGKGRFDDDEPDYSWLYEGTAGNADADG